MDEIPLPAIWFTGPPPRPAIGVPVAEGIPVVMGVAAGAGAGASLWQRVEEQQERQRAAWLSAFRAPTAAGARRGWGVWNGLQR